MTFQKGFTLIEVIIFIVVTALIANVILLALNTNLKNMPTVRQEIIAAQTAQQCMEWFLGQRRLKGYSSITCPSTPSPTFCAAPSGYTISTNITCTTINSDANYQTIVVTVSGNGNAVLTSVIANY